MGDYVDRAVLISAVGGNDFLVQLADMDGDGVEDAGVVDSAIVDAEGMVNSYVRKLFATPLSPVPAAIVGVTKRITVYLLKQQRNNAVTELDRLQYEDDLKWLKLLSKGEVDPGIASLAPSGHNRTTSTQRRSSKHASRESLKGFV